MKRALAEEVSDEAIQNQEDEGEVNKKSKADIESKNNNDSFSLSSSSSFSSSSAASSSQRLPFSIAVVCLSNLNRSMEAHKLLQDSGFPVKSFGAGSKVRLPGESKGAPNVYEFGTPYADIVSDLLKKNEHKYQRNGILPMVERNKNIKLAPDRFQDHTGHFQLILTYEKRVYEAVCADLESRDTGEYRGTHIINLETRDNHTEAAMGAKYSLSLVRRLAAAKDWEDEIASILDSYEESHEVSSLLHTVVFY